MSDYDLQDVTVYQSFFRPSRSPCAPIGEPADEAQREAWTITESVLVLLRDSVRAHGAELLVVTATSGDGSTTVIDAKVRIDTPVDLDYYRNGGILQTVLRKLLAEG